MDVPLSPMQQRTLESLRRDETAVTFDDAFITELVDDFERAIDEMGERLDEDIYMSKNKIAGALGCQEQYLLDDEFSWNPKVAGGQVAHRAIQLMLHWTGDPVAADLVDEAIARLADETRGIGDWIAGLSDADRADLRHFATDKVIKFQECFPPLKHTYYPATESLIRWPTRGPIMLSGKSDLTLGKPRGNESTKLIIDLKTGRFSPQHQQDLRFYALLETLRTRVPPRKLATFYLDSGEPIAEDVTEGVLLAASRRTLDAINTHIALTVEGAEPERRARTTCHWCPKLPDCSDGQRFINHDDE